MQNRAHLFIDQLLASSFSNAFFFFSAISETYNMCYNNVSHQFLQKYEEM